MRRFHAKLPRRDNGAASSSRKSKVNSPFRLVRRCALISIVSTVAIHEYLQHSGVLFNPSHPMYPYVEWLTPAEQVVQGSIRFMRVLRTCAKVGYKFKHAEMMHTEEWQNNEELRSSMHKEAAKEFLDLFVKNGGIYIKFGQYMSTMNNMLPKEWIDTLAVLQDHAPWVGYEQVQHLILHELGKPISELFVDFEETPIAAASLAQVHKAKVLVNSETVDVAVKVQYPRLHFHYTGDMAAKRIFVDLLQKSFPKVDFSWLGPELEQALVKELDFMNEYENMKRCDKLFSHRTDIYIPKVLDSLTSRKVLTMEFIDGVKINDVDGIKERGCSIKDAARTTFEVFAEMIYLHGWLHSDPHPGNILVRKDPKYNRRTQVVLLDHGLYKEVTDEFRVEYCKLWRAMVLHDDKEVEAYCAKLGVTDYKMYAAMVLMRGYETSSVGMADHGTVEQWNMLKERMFGNAEAIADMFNKMPKDMLLIFRTLSLLRGINQELGIPVNRFEVNARVANKGIYYHTKKESHKSQTWLQWIKQKRTEAQFELVLRWYEYKYYLYTVIYRIAIYFKIIEPFRLTVGKDDIDAVLAA